MDQIRIIKEMRNESIRQLSMRGTAYTWGDIRPRYMVLENVPGAFSSNKGEDFRAVLEETAKIVEKDASIPGPPGGKWPYAGCIVGDGWSIAWRVHDAQYWGVPQRRRRICMLADFSGGSAGRILFELQRETVDPDRKQAVMDTGKKPGSEIQSVGKSVPGNTQESGKTGKTVAGDSLQCTETASVIGFNRERCGAVTMDDAMPTLQAAAGESGNNQPMVCKQEPILLESNQNHATIHTDGISTALPASAGMGGGYVPMVVLSSQERTGALATHPQSVCSINGDAVCYGISSYDSNSMKSDNPNSGIYEAETSRTLDLNGGSPACNQGGMAVVCLEGNGSRDSHKGDGYRVSETMYTLNTVEQHAVFDARGNGKGDLSPTITGDHQNRITDYTAVCVDYPETTESLCASGYDKLGTQEAANDMYVVQSSWDGSQVSPTLTANNAGGNQRMPDKDNFNAVITTSHGGFMVNADDSGVAHTMEASDYKDQQIVCYGLDRAAYNHGENAKFNFAVDKEKVGTCVAKGPNAVYAVDVRNNSENEINGTLQADADHNCNANNIVRENSVVRRLTPLECERLQGFPDGWTDIGDWVDSKGKTHKGDSDSPRYKALGNSIALPFWRWMAERIRMHYPDCVPTMASLFDGIGGFPLVFSQVCVEPVWASEIEEFPMQVTKKHFSDTV